MKAITIHQPYASMIADGIKTIETRSWKPPSELWGKCIAIHAAKRKPPFLAAEADFAANAAAARLGYGYIYTLPLGEVVATARLKRVDRVRAVDGEKAILESGAVVDIDNYGDFSVGRYLWQLDDIRMLDKPVPARGKQGLWEWTE